MALVGPRETGGVVIKAKCGNDCRRFEIHPSMALDKLWGQLYVIYELPEDSNDVLKYVDEEGDLVTLVSDAEFKRVVHQMTSSHKAVRLVLLSRYRSSDPVVFKDSRKNSGSSLTSPTSHRLGSVQGHEIDQRSGWDVGQGPAIPHLDDQLCRDDDIIHMLEDMRMGTVASTGDSATSDSVAEVVDLFQLVRAGDVASLVLRIDLIKRLVNQRDPNPQGRRSSLLHSAAGHGKVEIVTLLLDAGANVNAPDDYGLIPLHNAATYGHYMCVQALLAGGSRVDALDDWGRTALHQAARHGKTDCLVVLLRHGADPSVRSVHGHRPVDLTRDAESRHTLCLFDPDNEEAQSAVENRDTLTRDESRGLSSRVPVCAAAQTAAAEEEELLLWLRSLNVRDVGRIEEKFREHEITDRQSVSYLTEQQLKDMGIVQIGIINKILNTPFGPGVTDWETLPSDEPPPYVPRTVA